MTTYAFIDGQNLHSGIKELGWRLDYGKFRAYLSSHYAVSRAFYFIGYMASRQHLYANLSRAGYDLAFKPVVQGGGHNPKGNVDADLVLRAMIEYPNYDRAVLVTGDGDFYSLVDHLTTEGKLRMVLAPNRRYCSHLLATRARGNLHFVQDIRHLVEE